ncbi:Alkaline phosphatase synthesis sensor protein PhoR [Paraliobacillus sp. PM-2]|uniref:sensor histidine kinase n=1 Tax=Paraliobacillus sp. PM-2 TaxID=1462524 RepID=UPI00061C4FB2|nr:ATP-binding protein [Paraliobacillus sp. PM-2]CQR47320.1 Alkaline phosphatase synthesis sensor protein PhoR [Paraliobacillus sp. PM-2]
MNLTFKSRIFIYLLIVSLCGVFITSFTIFFGVENQFSDYLKKNREEQIAEIREIALLQYDRNGELMNEQIDDITHRHAMSEDLYYQLYDRDGDLLLDTTSFLSMMGMMNGMHGSSSKESDNYQSDSYPLKQNGRTVGTLVVFYPEELTGEDFIFLNEIKRNILLAVLITIILSVLFSLLFSNRLTTGLRKIIHAVTGLRKSQWRSRVPVQELTEEMRPLGESFNQLAESLAKEETLRKQFTANFAHELRTPLATLRSHIEAFQDGIWEADAKKLEQCHDELMRLVRLVNELEKLIAAENPQIRLDRTNIELGKLLTSIENQFSSLFMKKGVDLKINYPEEQRWFSGDRDKVIQILTNLVNNALQYTPEGKSVFIDIAATDTEMTFIVKDEGKGISKEDLPFLYERFYRGDKSRDRKTGGIGIGLSIVKALVEAHQGKIKIQSQLGVGTTVKVQFPIK